jgi:hypothetical protein
MNTKDSETQSKRLYTESILFIIILSLKETEESTGDLASGQPAIVSKRGERPSTSHPSSRY